jgi:hypothetical protein
MAVDEKCTKFNVCYGTARAVVYEQLPYRKVQTALKLLKFTVITGLTLVYSLFTLPRTQLSKRNSFVPRCPIRSVDTRGLSNTLQKTAHVSFRVIVTKRSVLIQNGKWCVWKEYQWTSAYNKVTTPCCAGHAIATFLVPDVRKVGDLNFCK